ncbi:EamA family transporter [Prevotella melaninogenica]|uniref:EamA family transporter n=1 Tax=Prevotella melaninogenica TaxID=28132 RepID=UPI001C5FA6EC|nr:EamA family transporter [Prevotella melaninogenica]MBW4733732.1 DMT family transporter [Prevotella melaninogenica]MBW4736175.1 DMT family transporter [Prevotella melaninogenica]
MWILLAFVSATLLGLYDTSKKFSLRGNDVIPVLFLNTLFCSAIFLPLILLSQYTHVLDSSIFHVGAGGWEMHRWIILKSVIVLLSWVFGYFAIAQLPLTIVGPINATRPVMTLVGAMLVFGERLNAWQWVGVSLAIISLFLLARSGKREGIDFKHNKWIFFLVLAAMMGTCSGLLDKYLMASPENGGVGLDRMMAQSWYNIYQCIMMGVVLLVYIFNQRKKAERTVHFSWKWSILLISIFLSMADFAYFYALSLPGAMISIVSMVRRGSVLVSFLCGALLFREKNLKAKAIDLCFVLLGMIFLWIGSR